MARANQPIVSAAAISGASVVLLVERAGLLQSLARHARQLSLVPLPGVPPALHPVVLDFWQLRRGRMEIRGVDQSTALAVLGVGLGAAAGACVGAVVGGRAGQGAGISVAHERTAAAWGRRGGGLLGSAAGAALGAVNGLGRGAARGQTKAQAASNQLSDRYGNYDEVMLSVPGTTLGRGREAYSFVLGMFTNAPSAVWADRTFRYGYGKQLAQLDFADGNFAVGLPRQGPLLRANVAAPTEPNRHGPPALDGWFRLPLLAFDSVHGSFRASRLIRHFEQRSASWAPALSRVEVTGDLFATLAPGCYADAVSVQAACASGSNKAVGIAVA